jgi:hypothetical protein
MGRNFNGDSSAIFSQTKIMIFCPTHTLDLEKRFNSEFNFEFQTWLNGGWAGNFPLRGYLFNFITPQEGDFCYECYKNGVKKIVQDKKWVVINEKIT